MEETEDTYTVRVNWVVGKDYEVKAKDADEAYEKVEKMVNNGEVCVWTDGFETGDDVQREVI